LTANQFLVYFWYCLFLWICPY